MIATILALVLAAPQGDPAPEPPAREIVFARGAQGAWSMEGRTIVHEGSPARLFAATEPTIDAMICGAGRNGLKVWVGRAGGLSIEIVGSVVENGRERRLRELDLRSLVLDGTMWEAQARSRHDFTERFSDVTYAEPELGFRQYSERTLTVRRPHLPVWLGIDTLADDLLRAHMLRLGFREQENSVELEEPMIWIDVPLDGLGDALSWCRRAMTLPNALRLNPDQPARDLPR